MLKVSLGVLLVCFSIVAQSQPEPMSARMVMETEVTGADGVRLAINFGQVAISEIPSRLKIGEKEHLVREPSRVLVFIPADLPRDERTKYITSVKSELSVLGSRSRLTVEEIPIDVETIRRQGEQANASLSQLIARYPDNSVLVKVAGVLQKRNFQQVMALQYWEDQFKTQNWNHRERDELMGSILGTVRGVGYGIYWLTYTGVNVFGGAQALISAISEIGLSRYIKQFADWKGIYRFPFWTDREIVKVYNESPMTKDFLISTSLGLFDKTIFRTLSWANDPSLGSPLSARALQAMFGGQIFSSFFDSLNSQGSRRLRRKGWITNSQQFYWLQVTDLIGDLESLFYGSGQMPLYWTTLFVDLVTKIAISDMSYLMPLRPRRVIIFHPAIGEHQLDDLLYLRGLDDAKSLSDAQLQDDLNRALGREALPIH